MAYKNPVVPTINNPVFVDQAIQEIQTQISNEVSWLSRVFGRAYPKAFFRSGAEEVKPFVYQGEKEYLPVQFNDNLQAQSFFVVGNQTVFSDEFDNNLLNNYQAPVGLIVWANLQSINSTKGDNYYFAEELKRDVRRALTNSAFIYSQIEIEEIIENRDEVMSEFTFEEADLQYFTYPYVAFRINFNMIIFEECA